MVSLLLLGACSGPSLSADFESIDPQERTLALAQAVRSDDRARIPEFIKMLDDPDPATRMLAIGALNRWTGETLDYDHADPETKRRAAVDRWENWAREQGLVPGGRAVRASLVAPEDVP